MRREIQISIAIRRVRQVKAEVSGERFVLGESPQNQKDNRRHTEESP